MKYFKFVCYSLLLMLLFNTSSLYAAPPLDHTLHTPLSLMPEPLSGSHDTLKLAATWWLPDWQGGQGSRGSDDDGGGDIDGECETYGFVTKCAPPKVSGGIVHPISGLTCHKSCSCPSEYKYSNINCNDGYRFVAGDSCDRRYTQCVCLPLFQFNSSNCNGEFYPTGMICTDDSGSKFERCEMWPDCMVSSKECTYGCKAYNTCDRCIECKTNPDCDVSDKSCTYGCASYNSCSKCTSCKSNPDCSATAVSCDYGCASTNSCGICTSCSGNPDCNVSDKSCDCGCSSTNSCGKCTSCKSCPPEDPCSGISCGANAYCSGGSCYCNSGYEGNANSGCTKVDTCVSGGSSSCSGQTSSCSSSQVQTASCKDCSGTTRYTCRAKTCAEQGKKDCNGSCISSSECCGGCPSGYSCKNGSCEKDHTHSYSCPSGYALGTDCPNAPTTSGTCSCGAVTTCYKFMNSYDGQDCAENTCPTFTCTCCESFGGFQAHCCSYD